jgi:FtsZ-binding cell division protein ZapB
MGLRHKSIVTISNPEFINLSEDAINPGISKCEIKVFYLGQNRNGSAITRDVAEKMAQTLPGTPIVGVFKHDKDDFAGHGEVITIDDDGISVSCETVPYGFVSPDTKVWFQEFDDEDEFGNVTTHEYMMANGYLWTGQYPEITKAVTEGLGQSMELNPDVEGHWSTDSSTGWDFFIIDDASFKNLCVLGDDTEPCFEGASVTAPTDLSKSFTNDSKEFSERLYEMMREFKFSLGKEESELKDEPNDNKFEELQARIDELTADNKSIADKFEAMTSERDELASKNSELEKQIAELTEFKNSRIRADKQAVIDKYDMLSDEDKADVVDNIDDYSVEQIDEKLALVYVKKNVSFDGKEGCTTFSLTSNAPSGVINDDIDPLVMALRGADKL